MSTAEEEDSSQFADVEFEDAERSLASAFLSVWYIWLATLISAIFTYVAFSYQVTPSPVDQIVFTVTTILLIVAGIAVVKSRWEA